MAMSDEVRTGTRYKQPAKKKKKKGFVKSFIPQKGDKPSEIISKIIALISVIALIVCGIVLGIYFYYLYEAKQNHNNIKVIYSNASGNSGSNIINSDIASQDKAIERKPLILSAAASEMLAINPDYAGFVKIPGCVNEAVVQTDNNEYYLDRNIYDQKRSCGTIFADYRCVINDYEQSDNIILYGHNQRDGTMFGQMDFYKWDYKYWLKNQFIYLDTKYEENTYVIISSFIINTEPEHDNGFVFDYQNYIDFKDTGEYTFENFLSEINARSHFLTGIDIKSEDKFITLSTCSYEWEPSRHVIIARKLRSGETVQDIDASGFTVNPNPKWPAIYYKYNGGSYSE